MKLYMNKEWKRILWKQIKLIETYSKRHSLRNDAIMI